MIMHVHQRKMTTNRQCASVWSQLLALVMTVICCQCLASSVYVSSVTARQRYPWNGKVDVEFELSSTRSNVVVNLSAVNQADWTVLPMNSFESIDGTHLTSPLIVHPGKNQIVWDAPADLPAGFKAQSLSIKVSAVSGVTPQEKLFCVIDLSGGTAASTFPVYYLNAIPVGGWTDEYKTTKLVLRRIPSGTFSMGHCGPEKTDPYYDRFTNDTVTLTRDFYIGVFEVTQKQYELVMGNNPSVYQGDLRPVEGVSYNMIRGSDKGSLFPSDEKYRYSADAGSFLAVIREKSGLVSLDLPTSAQWEYACRAGTVTMFSDGVYYSEENDLDTGSFVRGKHLGRYRDTQDDGRGGVSEHTDVGLYQPNNWGLYDMYGNVCEWCLDWCPLPAPYSGADLQNSGSGKGLVLTDPLGKPEGTYRTLRGGGWCTVSYYLQSGYNRWRMLPNETGSDGWWLTTNWQLSSIGFRLAIQP